jgi:hypothetical protein
MNLFQAIVTWARFRLMFLLFPRGGSVGACGNRRWRKVDFGSLEVTLAIRDRDEADGYSREELMGMLETVREQEALQGWKVPEPAALEGRVLS